MMLSSRNALVTGGAHRLGAAIVRELAAAGANVFIHYHSSEQAAEELAEELRVSVSVLTGSADLRDPHAAAALIEEASTALGTISLLVNNASGFPEDTLQNATVEGFEEAIAGTLRGPVFLTQAFAAALPDEGDGAVVNISDARTGAPYRKHFSYMIAKGGVETFTRAAAVALGPRIRVNAVAPGVVLPPPGEDDEYVQRQAAALPLEKVGGSDPIAHAVRCLLENDFITGEIVRVDGGGHLTTAVA